MLLRNIVHLYRIRIRSRLAQELLATLGILAGVALLFAAQVANQSLTSSVATLSHAVTGNATLQLLARSPHGMPETMLAKVRAIGGVNAAAPLLEAPAQAAGPGGHASVELIGADASLKQLHGALVQHTDLEPFAGIGAILLPAPLAEHLHLTRYGAEATLRLYGREQHAPLYRQLHHRDIGALTASPIVVAPLSYAQELAGLTGRVSRILIAPAAGQAAPVREALRRLAGAGLDVQPTSYDETLFATAATASNQSTELFALIGALVGFLFAYNAMLLTVAGRRRLASELRRDGYTPGAVLAVILLDAVVLGAIAGSLGLAAGQEISLHLFGSNPGYLGSAFTVGTQRTVGLQTVLISLAGGLLAASVAILGPVRQILSRRTPAGQGEEPSARRRTVMLTAALAALALAGASVVLLAAPRQAVLGMILLTAALVLVLPAALELFLALLARVARLHTGAGAHIAAIELRGARGRALAVTATAAVALFGAVAIQGAHTDLLKGLENAARDENAYTDIWVSPPGAYDLLRTAPFTPNLGRRLARVAGVRSVAVYRGGLLDWGRRRVWVIAPPAGARPLVPATQITNGTAVIAAERLRSGAAVVLSRALAEEHHLHVGDPFTLPAPRPVTVTVAALSTNIGWAPGAITMTAEAFARAWASPDASAYNILLRPGAQPGRVLAALRATVGPGLAVQSARGHESEQNRLSRQGLDRLTQIAVLILAAAVLASAAALSSMISQRRPALAKLKLEGFSRAELWRTLLLQALTLLLVAALTGATLGLYGQILLDHVLAQVVNFPVVYSLAIPGALGSLAVVTGTVLLVLAVPGYRATAVAPAVALQD